jgi:nuclear transport factor 2 (NTF2) superfamily protein
VALVYTPDSQWRNRAEFPRGRAEIVAFLTRKWARELDYRLIKELWTFAGNRIAVRFAYEWRDDSGNWFRSYATDNWEFATTEGLSGAPSPLIKTAHSRDERKFSGRRAAGRTTHPV